MRGRLFALWVLLALAAVLPGCRRRAIPDGFEDYSFHSEALGRTVTYRLLRAPAGPGSLRVAYLLHGHGESYREWSEDADWRPMHDAGWTLVMPEGRDSYFLNAVGRPEDRYENFVTGDLRREVEAGRPVERRALIGVSMGGYAALVLALRHPELYRFAGALSPPVAITTVPLTWKHPARTMMLRRIFGPTPATSIDVQPAALVRELRCEQAPSLFVSAGAQEPLLRDIAPFADLLRVRGYRYRFHVLPGGHDWTEWNAQMPALLEALEQIPASGCEAVD